MAPPVLENAQCDHPSLWSHGGFTDELGGYWFPALGRRELGGSRPG